MNAIGIKKVEMEQRRKRMDELEGEIRRIKNGRDALEIEARSRKELAGRIELSEPTSPPISRMPGISASGYTISGTL